MEEGTTRMSSIAYTLQHLLERFNEELLPEHGGVNIGGRRIKYIRFPDDMTLLAKDEKMLKNMLMEPDDRCEDIGMKINMCKTKPCLSEENQSR